MASKFNYRFTAGLDTKEFKKGVAEIKTSMKGMMSDFKSFTASLGAGIGFTALTSRVKDTIKELSTAEATLRNVSKGVSEYDENVRWLKSLSKDLSQEYVGLTLNFAQFHAACENTSISLKQQRDIFESLTQAATYYHLSADKTSDMMTAIVQMMSKGKVAAEELRRQLGNALPGAFNLMAEAMGVSTAELEDMMKKGKLMSDDALPKFARKLKEVTGNIDLNSIQLQLNALQNAWTSLVSKSGAESIFSGGIKALTRLMELTEKYFGAVKAFIYSIAGSSLLQKTLKLITTSANKYIDTMREGNKKLIADNDRQIKQAEELLRLNKIQGVTKKQLLQKNGDGSYTLGANEKTIGIGKNKKTIPAVSDADYQSLQRYVNAYNKGLTDINTNAQKLNNTIAQGNTITGKMGLAMKNLGRSIAATFKAMSATLIWNGIFLAISAIISLFTKLYQEAQHFKDEIKRINSIIKDQRDEIKKSDEATQESIVRARKALEMIEKANSRTGLQEAINDLNEVTGLQVKIGDSYDVIKGKVDGWEKSLRRVAAIQARTNLITDNEQRKLSLQARQERILEEEHELRAKGKSATSKKIRDLEKEYSLNKKEIEELGKSNDQLFADLDKYYQREVIQGEADFFKSLEINPNKTKAELQEYLNKYGKMTDVHPDHIKLVQKWLDAIIKQELGDGKLNSAQKIAKKYEEERAALAEKRKAGLITAEEYTKELVSTIDSYITNKLEDDKGFSNTEEYKSLVKELSALKEAVKNAWQDKTKEIFEQYQEDVKNVGEEQKALGLSSEWAKDEIKSLNEGLIKSIVKFGSLDDMLERINQTFPEFSEVLKGAIKSLKESRIEEFKKEYGEIEKPEAAKQRDTTFDYKNDPNDIAKENLENNKERVKALENYKKELEAVKKKYKDLSETEKKELLDNLDALEKELKARKANVSSLEYQIKLTENQKDIKDLRKKVLTDGFKDFKSIADGVDRLAKAFKDLRETMEDVDATGWDKFFAILDMVAQSVDTISSAIVMISTLTKTIDTLGKAKEASSAIKPISDAAETTGIAAETIALGANTAAQHANTEAKVANTAAGPGLVASATAGAAASTAEATAAEAAATALYEQATAAVAAATGINPLLGTAAAASVLQATAMVSAGLQAIKTAGKFSNGGIVRGESNSGDNLLARVNSGEMILSKADQSTLFNAIKTGNFGSTGGKVDFEIRGDKLFGVLKNYQSKKRG